LKYYFLKIRNSAKNKRSSLQKFPHASCIAITRYDTRPISGNINLLGGIIQHTSRAFITFGSGGIRSGFAKKYR
jgi:hypothetical protein